MSEKSTIEWTDATWNPTRGCTKISPGCAHCYAETFAERFRGVPGHPYEQGFDPRLAPDKLDAPLGWRKPRRIFVNSMSDLFHADFPADYIASVFGVMAYCRRHTFQVLTKRAEGMAVFFNRYLNADPLSECLSSAGLAPDFLPTWPLDNVWLGVSVENQRTADDRIPHLLRTPAAVRFLSVEPLLGPVDLSGYFGGEYMGLGGAVPNYNFGIHWVIVGGESGPGARPMLPDWARSVRDQCVEAGVPFFFKQHGEWAQWETAGLDDQLGRHKFESHLFSERPYKDIPVVLHRVGKKKAGRRLDGRTWDQMPEPAGERAR